MLCHGCFGSIAAAYDNRAAHVFCRARLVVYQSQSIGRVPVRTGMRPEYTNQSVVSPPSRTNSLPTA